MYQEGRGGEGGREGRPEGGGIDESNKPKAVSNLNSFLFVIPVHRSTKKSQINPVMDEAARLRSCSSRKSPE